ncbi:MAG TPA: FlgD immunoglobulin-like domain containing protein, partial [Candidatus Krumholzibacteria bacterium]|nr:FlgD immunoglobulin-like domain containing protein [Candidatus Krumholzibacteria bacterium]
QNDLSSNDIGIETNVDYLTVDASCNWYGDINGPFEATLNPAGTGSAVEGDVDFGPWLVSAGGACTGLTNFASAGPAPGELNDCDNCLDIPVSLTRLDTSAARGVSVTFELSSNLELCGTPAVSSGAGTFYDGFGNVQALPLITVNDSTYTFDTAILGEPCGSTVGGEVFTIPVTFVSGLTSDQQGTIDIVGVTLRDCDNAPLPLLPGPGATIDIDVTAPGAITDLAAVQQKTGNTPPNTTAIDLSWTLPGDPDLTAVRVFRKGFGNYPEYDDLGGAAPTAPTSISDALTNGWTEVSGSPLAPTATSYSDEPGARDFWYYVAFAEDECYESAVSGRTDGTLSYHLGDVAPGTGNNIVFTGDISDLGDAYGTFDGDANYDAEADVGPTTDFSVDARPTTDNQIQFEDLILFAINFNQVSKLAPAQLAAANTLELVEPTELTAGDEIRVPLRLSGDGSVQGLTVELGWNSDVLEYVGWAPGDIASAQNRAMPVFSPTAGVIDAAMMGVADTGIAGEGTLAHLRFRVKAEGPTDLRFDSVDARSATNEEVSLSGTLVQEASGTPAMLSRSVLRSNVPNPFNPSTKVRFALADRGHVSVQIFDLKGRLVRTLVDAPLTAGEHEIQWNGTDDGGRTVASGTYLLRMSAPDVTESRRLMLVK